ncbi:hypothetical protein H5410_032587 [Solanum commersonii]|uniref:Terpene synthase N-terminal domain-containing protein n=1 Tax=Solanum commersonii TaxID=4109 RepID=A0A9J5YLG3_SOLCO|nr:hypothetical protein H5410_032587 [Solanum commersonii]
MLMEICDNISYHFHNEIKTFIQNIFDASSQKSENNDNLDVVSLRFRLVRQQGHYISSGTYLCSIASLFIFRGYFNTFFVLIYFSEFDLIRNLRK